MRVKSLLAALAAVAAFGLASPQPASAFVRCERDVVTGADRCRYHYEPVGYYPYYNSGYWVPARVYKRPRYGYKLPRYYKAWGYPQYAYDNVEWHNRKYGRISHAHW